MTAAFKVIGFIGSSFISAALVPQVYTALRTESTDDVSLPFVCLFMIGQACVVSYGIGESLWPIYIPALFEFAGMLTLFTLKLHYNGKRTETKSITEE